MELFDAIYGRRSIRKYTGEKVSAQDEKAIIRAACYAPSAHNNQPWRFIVVREPKTLEHIAGAHPYAKMLPQAGMAIVVCGDTSAQSEPRFIAEDCGAAIQNLLLAAHGLGLGAVWCGLYPIAERAQVVAEALGIPEGIIPVGIVAVGHPAQERTVGERFSEDLVHYEKW